MIVVVQRVLQASVQIKGRPDASIGKGLMILVGIEDADGDEDVEWLSSKIVNLRIFNDSAGVMNISILEDGGDILLVSQFTLHASTKKGNRPSYIKAAKPEKAVQIYQQMVARVQTLLGKEIKTGEFGADMKVSLVNDGPVTIIIDSKNRV